MTKRYLGINTEFKSVGNTIKILMSIQLKVEYRSWIILNY